MRRASYPRSSPTYVKAYAALYGRRSDRPSAFCRDRLPDPSTYYRKHLDKLHVRGDWARALCPFHNVWKTN
jgi:hypothetical protein